MLWSKYTILNQVLCGGEEEKERVWKAEDLVAFS